jgi:hypothetical protein
MTMGAWLYLAAHPPTAATLATCFCAVSRHVVQTRLKSSPLSFVSVSIYMYRKIQEKTFICRSHQALTYSNVVPP